MDNKSKNCGGNRVEIWSGKYIWFIHLNLDSVLKEEVYRSLFFKLYSGLFKCMNAGLIICYPFYCFKIIHILNTVVSRTGECYLEVKVEFLGGDKQGISADQTSDLVFFCL